MRALELTAYDGKIRAVERPVPKPKEGELLIKVAAAPINPSDIMFLKGQYGRRKPVPVVAGFEGSGTVVGSGGGMVGAALMGRRVAFLAGDGDGSWAEYCLVPSAQILPLLPHLSLEDGSMLLVNPMTTYCLLDMARSGDHAAVVQTAAASQLGRMVVKLGRRLGVPIINVVRRADQVELIRKLGASHVVSTHEEDFDARLRQTAKELNATLALDAVSGGLSGRVLRAMPRGSRMVVYGALSEEPCQLDPSDLIFANKHVEGFWLSDQFKPMNLPGMLAGAARVQQWFREDFASVVQARFPLQDGEAALRAYQKDMTAGKVLLVPDGATLPAA